MMAFFIKLLKKYRKQSCFGPTLEKESGNALVYVLIVIALFAALSFMLSRQTDTSETSLLDGEKVKLYATNILQTATQVKNSVDQMSYTGTDIDDLIFLKPDDAGYNTAPHIHKVFHMQGGGIVLPRFPAGAVNEVTTAPKAGWYMGRFNNVEWTQSTGTDVILAAYQISKAICENINEKITGSTAIPALATELRLVLIDNGHFGGAPANVDLDTAQCAACEGYTQMCVSDNAVTKYGFYSIITAR